MLGYSTRRIKFSREKGRKTAANVLVNGKRWLPSHLLKLLRSQAPALLPTFFFLLYPTRRFSLPLLPVFVIFVR